MTGNNKSTQCCSILNIDVIKLCMIKMISFFHSLISSEAKKCSLSCTYIYEGLHYSTVRHNDCVKLAGCQSLLHKTETYQSSTIVKTDIGLGKTTSL